MARIRIGLDFGGVIVPAASDKSKEDTALGHDAILVDDPLPGAIEGVSALVKGSGGNLWIVSKAGPQMQERTRRWLHASRFCSRTGFEISHLHFCAAREHKATICRELGITHFIDDRFQVIQILRDVVPNLFMFHPPEDNSLVPDWATPISGWQKAPALILNT